MIYFNLKLDNPWYKQRQYVTDDFLFKHWQLGKHKNLELQISYWGMQTFAGLELDTRWCGHDHAGFRLNIELMGCMISMQLYDSRHWNYEEARWESHGEEDRT
jgi:hypothetical protein